MGREIITSGPIKQALINRLRANNPIQTAAVGGVHEGLNTRDTVEYPFVVVSIAVAVYDYTWSDVGLLGGFDIVVRGPNPVEVNSLDALITAELNDSTLAVTGPGETELVTLNLRREEELPLSPERNAMGKKIYQNGAFYSVEVAHPLEEIRE